VKPFPFFILFFALLAIARADALHVVDAAEWKKASSADAQAFARQPGIETLDLSGKAGQGLGYVLKKSFPQDLDAAGKERAVAEYISSIEKAGHGEVAKKPAALGPLSGYCVTSRGHSVQGEINEVTYLVFGTREMYTISILGPKGTNESSALVTEYMGRIRIPPEVASVAPKPAVRAQAIQSDNDRTVYWAIGAVVVAGVAMALFFHRRRGREVLPR